MTSDLILWLDLETTGNGEWDQIIELGAVLTDQEYNQVDSFQEAYRTSVAVSEIDPYVFDMHVSNGLWKATMEAKRFAATKEAESAILAWLGKAGAIKGGANSLPLAGSGTSHFDRRFIERTWPNLAKRLTFWNLDIGVTRRFMRQWLTPEDWERWSVPVPLGMDPKSHRAMDDVRQHLQEARVWRSFARSHG